MGPESSPAAFTLTVGDEAYLCARAPVVAEGLSLEAALAGVLEAIEDKRAPALLFWDGRIAEEDRRVSFGRGGLDPILASEADLSSCVAVSRKALKRLVDRGALKDEGELARAVAVLARSPGITSMWCPGLSGELDPAAPATTARPRGPATQVEAISLAVTVEGPGISVEPFFAALRGQAVAGQLDVMVLALNFESTALKGLIRTLEACAAADPRLKPRRYAFNGALSPAYLANMAAGLATADAVVLADARCVPVTSGAVQHLADWAMTGDAIAACPPVMFEGKLAAAGLALATMGEHVSATVWNDHLYMDGLRTAAAPTPWFFAFRRSAWLASGGLRETAGSGLWTSEFAFARGPRGRTLLVGTELVEWTAQQPPTMDEEPTQLHRNLQATTLQALRDPTPSDRPVVVPVAQAQAAIAPPSYTDPFPSGAALKVLVFADRFAASQSIAFVEGLAGARARGAIAVRIVDEEAFPGRGGLGDPAAAAAIVAHHFDETRPDVVVASRLARPDAWSAVAAAARKAGAPILFHIDDDIADLPAVLGTERYRLARNPRRLATLREALGAADLVLAATPALAERLSALVAPDRIMALRSGTAGRVSSPRTASGPGASLTIGYMGSASHDHDLAMAVPALNRILADYPGVRLVLFGSIAEQPAARALQGRIERHPPVRGDYSAFRRRLAELALDIGLAPLSDIAFNRVKTPTKWVEYAESGAAALVSTVGPYLPIVEQGAAMGVRPDQWESGLRSLIEDAPLRRGLVRRGDQLLADRFGWDRLEREVMSALAQVAGARRAAA